MTTHLETLRQTPRLQSLYVLLQHAELLHPTKVLVADTPFFVYDHGEIYEGHIKNPNFIPKHCFKKGSALVHELEVIARGIAQNAYPESDLERLQVWAQQQMRVIRKGLRESDKHAIRVLKRSNLLN